MTADLPPHFAESLEMLGFDLAVGDAQPAKVARAPGGPQRKVAAAAKARRRERRGERRARGAPDKAKRR